MSRFGVTIKVRSNWVFRTSSYASLEMRSQRLLRFRARRKVMEIIGQKCTKRRLLNVLQGLQKTIELDSADGTKLSIWLAKASHFATVLTRPDDDIVWCFTFPRQSLLCLVED